MESQEYQKLGRRWTSSYFLELSWICQATTQNLKFWKISDDGLSSRGNIEQSLKALHHDSISM